jgi:hypothetical protein
MSAWREVAGAGWVREYGFGLDAKVIRYQSFHPDTLVSIPGKYHWEYMFGHEQCGTEYDTAEEAMKACDAAALSTARRVVGKADDANISPDARAIVRELRRLADVQERLVTALESLAIRQPPAARWMGDRG